MPLWQSASIIFECLCYIVCVLRRINTVSTPFRPLRSRPPLRLRGLAEPDCGALRCRALPQRTMSCLVSRYVQIPLDGPDQTLSLVGSGRVVPKFHYTDPRTLSATRPDHANPADKGPWIRVVEFDTDQTLSQARTCLVGSGPVRVRIVEVGLKLTLHTPI